MADNDNRPGGGLDAELEAALERHRAKETKERVELLRWFAQCDLTAYPTGALEAAYKALVDYEDRRP